MKKTDGFPEGRVLFSRLARHARLRQLQLLLALQQGGSLVKAAASLDMSQSAATQALGELERVLGLRLFERHARGVRPTQAGQALIDAARGAMHELEDAAQTLAAIRLGASGALRLGAIPAASQAIVAPLVAAFCVRQPQVQVDVHEGDGARLLSLLLGGGLDAVFCRQPALLPQEWVFKPLLDDAAVFLAAPGHRWAHARRLALGRLADARWILPTASIAVREIFECVVLARFPQAEWFPVSTVSLPVLEQLLAQPRAVALVPRSIAPGLGQGAGGACVLDVVTEREALRLAQLGVVHRLDGVSPRLRELLAPWPMA